MKRNKTYQPTLLIQHTKASIAFIVWCLCIVWHLPAQTSLTDSLQREITQARDNQKKVDLLNDLAWEYKFERAEEARQLLQESILLAQKIGYPKGEAQAYNNLGVVEDIAGNWEGVEINYTKALEIRKKLGDKAGIASLYNNIGNLKESLGDNDGALVNLQQSLKIREELKDTIRIARVNYNLALIQEAMGNYPEALDYLLIHLAISEELQDNYEIANSHTLLGNIKSELERFEEAYNHHQKALKLRYLLEEDYERAIAHNNLGNSLGDLAEVKMDSSQFNLAFSLFSQAIENYNISLRFYEGQQDEEGLSQAYNNIGLVYKNLGTFYETTNNGDSSTISLKQAMLWLNKSLVIRKKLEDQKGIMEVYNGIGDVRRRQKKWNAALEYTEKYYTLAQQIEDPKFLQKAYKDFSRVYEGIGDYRKAFEFRKKYDDLRYKRLDEERTRDISRSEAQYGDIRKQYEIDRKNKELQIQESELQKATLQRRALMGGAIGLMLLAVLLYNRYRLKNKANKALAEKNIIIEKERQRSEELLLNILPAATAEELKSKGKADAKYYSSVSVLFTDFKSFTTLAERMQPEELVAELDFCFRAFDEITSKYGIEKIKTIGDAYMCAGGLPTPTNTHASDLVAAALEMQDFLTQYRAKRKKENRQGFEARIGIHTGPVVAGIVGSKKFAYDIWGDTVNTAARMESSGAPGKVNISHDTYKLIRDRYECIARGKIAAKNKGAIEMYFVIGKKN